MYVQYSGFPTRQTAETKLSSLSIAYSIEVQLHVIVQRNKPRFYNRVLYILRRERQRVRDFLNTKQCSRINQRHFGGKRDSPRRSTTQWQNKLSNVRSFSILQSKEVLTSFNNDNTANFSGVKKYNEEFRGVYFLTIREKTLNQISYLQSFSSSHLMVSNEKIDNTQYYEWELFKRYLIT